MVEHKQEQEKSSSKIKVVTVIVCHERDLELRLQQTANVRFKLTVSQIRKWTAIICPK